MSLTRKDVVDLLDGLNRLNRILEELTPVSLRVQESLHEVLQAAQKPPAQKPALPTKEVALASLDMDPAVRAEVERFVQVFGARVAAIIPRGQPTPAPVVPVRGARPADTPPQPNPPASTVVKDVAVETKEDREAWLQRQRKVQHGWLVLERLMRKNRRAALALRAQYPNDETPLLLRLAERGMPGVKEAGALLWRVER
jgi:hypothetical protein